MHLHWGGREEGRRPEPTLAPVPCCLHPSCTASIPMSCSLPSLPWLLGIRMVFTVAPPSLKWGAGQGRDLAPPLLSSPPSHHVSSVLVCVPCLLSASPLGRLARLLVHPAAFFTGLRLTFLGLSPPLLLPICSSQGCPWASDRLLRLSLCLSVHLSLCPSLSCDLQ